MNHCMHITGPLLQQHIKSLLKNSSWRRRHHYSAVLYRYVDGTHLDSTSSLTHVYAGWIDTTWSSWQQYQTQLQD